MHLLCKIGGLAGVGWWVRLGSPPHTGPSGFACEQRAQPPFPLLGEYEWLQVGCVVLGPPVEGLYLRLPLCLPRHNHK